jgi:hypothetical protein
MSRLVKCSWRPCKFSALSGAPRRLKTCRKTEPFSCRLEVWHLPDGADCAARLDIEGTSKLIVEDLPAGAQEDSAFFAILCREGGANHIFVDLRWKVLHGADNCE